MRALKCFFVGHNWCLHDTHGSRPWWTHTCCLHCGKVYEASNDARAGHRMICGRRP